MTRWRADVRLDDNSNKPEFQVSNTFYFDDPANIIDVTLEIETFYSTIVPATGFRLSRYLASTIARGTHGTAYWYDIDAPLPHSWDFRVPFEITGAAADHDLPGEVAVCLSYHADLVGVPEEAGSARPAARRRGRLYIGPLTEAAADHTSGAPSMPDSTFLLTLKGAAERLHANVSEWSQYSKVNDVMLPITGGFIDNEWDTRRSRGRRSTARTLWT